MPGSARAAASSVVRRYTTTMMRSRRAALRSPGDASACTSGKRLRCRAKPRAAACPMHAERPITAEHVQRFSSRRCKVVVCGARPKLRGLITLLSEPHAHWHATCFDESSLHHVRKQTVHSMLRRTRYAVAGGLLGLGAPVGLLCVRLLRHGFSVDSASCEIDAQRDAYIYSAASTTLGFALFGGVLGHYGDRLAQLAATDPLTDLFNARSFQDRLRHELGRVARYQEPLCLLLVDLDGLKRLNDEHGHAAGNDAIRSVAAAIRSELRETDLGARLGGDEFGVLAPRTTEEAGLVLAERLRARVAGELSGPASGGVTISIGIASVAPSRAERPTAAALMASADDALYLAKREGGNRVAARLAGASLGVSFPRLGEGLRSPSDESLHDRAR